MAVVMGLEDTQESKSSKDELDIAENIARKAHKKAFEEMQDKILKQYLKEV